MSKNGKKALSQCGRRGREQRRPIPARWCGRPNADWIADRNYARNTGLNRRPILL